MATDDAVRLDLTADGEDNTAPAVGSTTAVEAAAATALSCIKAGVGGLSVTRLKKMLFEIKLQNEKTTTLSLYHYY